MATIIIHESALNFDQSNTLERSLGKLSRVANHFQAEVSDDFKCEQLQTLREKTGLDINLVPASFQPKQIQLMISDMDSTLIGIECVDEIADMVNLKPQVSEITEAAMRGELDFAASLTKRVALLKDLEIGALEKVYNERLHLNPGAETWINGLKDKDIAFALVSGGFTYFTERLKSELMLDFTRANVLEVENNKLTGKVLGEIIGAQAKANFLNELCDQMGINLSQTMAIGDGANDLLMMHAAGLSIAYHAKPKVQEEADIVLNIRGLDAVLDLLHIQK